MKKLFLLLFAAAAVMNAQDLSGIRICVNPGHGGYDSNDRNVPETGFWESASNLTKGLALRDMLQDLGATVIMTRTLNRTVDDLLLSEIVAIANSNNADIMHSIHSNGYNGQSNYTLILFQGGDNSPVYPDAKILGQQLANTIQASNRTTTKYLRGDYDFYGTGTAYLGVFKGLNMPGTLSEGSFHDYIPESWRLMNEDYRVHEARAISRAFLNFYAEPLMSLGSLAGIVRNPEETVDYYYISTTRDNLLPVNNITVTLSPGGRSYTGDAMNNGFYWFDSLAPGDYTVTVNAENYYQSIVNVTVSAGYSSFGDVQLEAVTEIPRPPTTPENIRLVNGPDDSLRILCSASSRADEYIAYIYDASMVLIDSVKNTIPDIRIKMPLGTARYFRIAAGNDAGTSANSVRLYGWGRHSSGRKLLLVNGFDRSSNLRYDYVRYFGTPILQGGYGFDCALNESVLDGTFKLTDYDAVVWFMGDESTADESFSTSEQALVRTYLQGGGRLFVSGSEIAWDLDYKGSDTDKAFIREYLKAGYSADAPGNVSGTYYSVSGRTGSIFEGIGSFSFDNGSQGTIDVKYADALTALNGSSVAMAYNNVSSYTNAAVVYRGAFPGSVKMGAVVYTGFPFETVYPEAARTAIMGRVLDFFETAVSIDDSEYISTPETVVLHPNYPNPFNPTTEIRFDIMEAGTVNLEILDIRGRRIASLISNEQMPAGSFRRTWNGRDDQDRPASSGVYIIRLTQGRFTASGRCILMK